jgi:AraC-like DNA-binding protein
VKALYKMESLVAIDKIMHPFCISIWAVIGYILIISGLFYFIVQFFYYKKITKYRQHIDRIEKESMEQYNQLLLLVNDLADLREKTNTNPIQESKLLSSKLVATEVPALEVVANNQFMEKLIKIVQDHIDDPDLSINKIYKEMGVSRAQFFRKIKAISDISPNKIILTIRMNLAVDLLRSKQYNISEVAYKVGFVNPTYFSKVFKSVFDVTPSDFTKHY